METGALTVDDFLNFNLDVVENNNENTQKAPTPCINTPDFHQGLAFPEFADEELEWLSNKDAFPPVESYLENLLEAPIIILNHHSPVSVLDNIHLSNIGTRATVPVRYPMKPRSTSRQRRRIPAFPEPSTQHFLLWGHKHQQQQRHEQYKSDMAVVGRKCTHCQVNKTPLWREGPIGPKTLCNACGVRYKSGRLMPEYRPANSPTFSSSLHSNSHRKVIEMRKHKELCGEVVDKPCAYTSDVVYL